MNEKQGESYILHSQEKRKFLKYKKKNLLILNNYKL